MPQTTLARVNEALSGTGLVLSQADVANAIADADEWYASLGTPQPVAAAALWEVKAKTFWVLLQIAFAPFRFSKADASKGVEFEGLTERWLAGAEAALVQLGLVTDDGGLAIRGIEDGIDYRVPGFGTYYVAVVVGPAGASRQ